MARDKRMFDEFPPVSTEEWVKRINADLKGADFKEKLVWKTGEGFDVSPFYRKEDISDLPHMHAMPGEFPYVRGSREENNNWLIRQNIDVVDYKESNRAALEILGKGADSIGFRLKSPGSVNRNNLQILLNGINPLDTELNIKSEGKGKEIVGVLIRHFEETVNDPAQIRGSVEEDLLGRLLSDGNLPASVDAGMSYLAAMVRTTSSLSSFRTILVNTSDLVDTGYGVTLELALGLSMGNEYLVQLTEKGISPDKAASSVKFSFGTGSNYFFEIAKLRAARLLWSALVKAYEPSDLKSARMEIHCVTGKWNKTVDDPYVNLLRTQTEAMSAVLGGTDSLTVNSFDPGLHHPAEFSERLARNQQLLLKEEASFSKVADPGAGSYYIEKLTSMIADSSWKLFTDIEEIGGFLSALQTGYIRKIINDNTPQRIGRNQISY